MPNKRISELTEASSVDGSEHIEIVQGGVNKKSLISKIKDYVVALFTLTDGSGTTANGTAVDLGGTSQDITIDPDGDGTRDITLGNFNSFNYFNLYANRIAAYAIYNGSNTPEHSFSIGSVSGATSGYGSAFTINNPQTGTSTAVNVISVNTASSELGVVKPFTQFTRRVQGTPVNGIGGSLIFRVTNSINSLSPIAGISYILTDVTSTSEDSKYVVSVLINGTETQIFEIDQYGIKPLVDIPSRTGTAIAFDREATYGDVSAETGNITLDSTGLRKGISQLLIHNSGSTPTFGAEFKIIGGEYVPDVDNYIHLSSVSSSLILVTISQEVV